MKKQTVINHLKIVFFLLVAFVYAGSLPAQNPFIRDQYTADPSARVFGDRVYVYPSHDILATEGKGRVGWFCMEDYHVFSSTNLVDWTDHGVIVQQNKVPWVRPDSYSMWAPDCIERNGKYYFYFPTAARDTVTYGRGFTIGVAIADKPEGPYVPHETPIKGVRGIDPNVFIDRDGQAYLYWSAGNIYGAKLADNMLELASEVKVLGELPAKGLKEGPYVFERSGLYYLTYPHVENKTERLEYAIGNNPLGPFKVTGVIMDESPTGCWTNHHSIIQFRNQWYLFYHHNDYSPRFDKARSTRIDSLFFNPDGTIKKVIPTLRGVGLADATRDIQVDRFSNKAEEGVAIDFIDTANRFQGWKTIFRKAGSWVQFNSIDFKNKPLAKVVARVQTERGGDLELRLGEAGGPLLAKLQIPASTGWKELQFPVLKFRPGIQNLFVIAGNDNEVQLDWVRFR
jgi:hypothetical protein